MAVLATILTHTFPGIFPGGFIGVDVFFVISGFLISSIILRNIFQGNFSYSIFYYRRIRRIFPALIIILIFCLIVGFFMLSKDEYFLLGKHTFLSSIFVSNYIFSKEFGHFKATTELKPLSHLWSLCIEEQFYILFPCILVFFFKRNLFFILIILFFVSFTLNIFMIKIDSNATFYLLPTRIWELTCGSIIAYYNFLKEESVERKIIFLNNFSGNSSTFIAEALSLIGFILFFYSVMFIHGNINYPGWYALLPTLSSCLIIIAGPQALINRRIFSDKDIVRVGLISYPLYLWHWPILIFSQGLTNYFSNTLKIYIKIFSIFASIFLAWATYNFLEKPIRLNKRLEAKNLLIVLIVIGLIGYVIQF